MDIIGKILLKSAEDFYMKHKIKITDNNGDNIWQLFTEEKSYKYDALIKQIFLACYKCVCNNS